MTIENLLQNMSPTTLIAMAADMWDSNEIDPYYEDFVDYTARRMYEAVCEVGVSHMGEYEWEIEVCNELARRDTRRQRIAA